MTQELVKTYTEQLVAALNKCTEKDDPRIRRTFTYSVGKRYYKIGELSRFTETLGSAEAFVDKTTGDVYKPAGWSKPAEHVRYNLLDRLSREECLDRADPYGSYLYLR